MAKIDTSGMTDKERKQLEALLKKGGTSLEAIQKKTKEKSLMSNPEYVKACMAFKPRLEELCEEHSREWMKDKGIPFDHLTLQNVYTASDKKRAVYRHTDGKTWNSKGKMPAWLDGRKELYLVREDGKTNAERPADSGDQTDLEDAIHNSRLDAIAAASEAPETIEGHQDGRVRH